jgi:PKD repeat protein
MSYALVGSKGAVSGSSVGGSVTPAWGSGEGRTAGNLLLLWVEGHLTATLPSAPAGWSIGARKAGSGGLCSASVFYKIAAGGDSAPTVAAATGTLWNVQLAEFSGNAMASTLDQTGSASGTSTPEVVTAASVDATPGDLVVVTGVLEFTISVTNPSSTHTLNNGAGTWTNSSQTGTAHYNFAYGVTTGNSSADSDSYSFDATFVNDEASVLVSFRPSVVVTKTQTAEARVAAILAATQTAKARVHLTYKKQTAIARIAGHTPRGVSIAFDDDALTDNPTWTRIDDYPGIMIESIVVDRGRTDERSKTVPGTVTVSGYDTVGALDPTNPTGPWYGKLDPTKQASVAIPNPVDSSWHQVFVGHTAELIWELDISENFGKFEIQFVDMLDLLNDAEVIPDSAGNFAPGENVGDCYYTGQHVDDRLFAVLADTATSFLGVIWPTSKLQIFSGNVYVQGGAYGRNTSMLQIIDEACDAEGSFSTNRFATKTGAFAFRGRYARYAADLYLASSDATRHVSHQIVKWGVGDLPSFASDNTLAVGATFKVQRGKANLINTALCTPQGIPTSKVSVQAVHDPTSIAKYGVRTGGMSLENLKMSAGDDGNTYIQEAKSFGEAIKGNYKNPVTRVPQMAFKNPPKGDVNRLANTWSIICGIELSDIVTIYTQHPGGGGLDGVQHFVEKIHYDISQMRDDEWLVTLTLDLSPRAYYSFTPESWLVPSGSGLSADFNYTQQGDLGSTLAVFADTSRPGPSGPITDWAWDFGDGNTSTDQYPVHDYGATGLYSAKLTVTGTPPDGTAKTVQSVILV